MDSSTFPSERCAEKLRDGNLQTTLEIPILHLVYEYIMMNIENPIVRKGTIKALLVSLYHNIYSILTLVISYNLVKILNAPLCHETVRSGAGPLAVRDSLCSIHLPPPEPSVSYTP